MGFYLFVTLRKIKAYDIVLWFDNLSDSFPSGLKHKYNIC